MSARRRVHAGTTFRNLMASQKRSARPSHDARVGFKNGMMGGLLGALFSYLLVRPFAGIVADNWGNAAGWLVLAAGPFLGFLLAAILGDRFLERVDNLL